MPLKRFPALLTSAAALLALVTCAAPGAPAAASVAQSFPQDSSFFYEIAAPEIRAKSCAAHTGDPTPFSPISLSATALTEAQAAALAKRLPAGASLAGGWELTSDDPNFGGLSGLALAEGNLLAVTDAGGWVALGLIDDAPASAAIAYMKGADGRFLSGKTENDAEGLAWREGIAFVSYERDFRVEAFDLGGCGAAAMAVRVAALPGEFEGKPVDTNSGPEALALTPEGALLFGYEGLADATSPIGQVLADGTGRWTGRLADNPKGFALVAMDVVRLPSGEEREIALYRAFDPVRGARSVLVWGAGEDQRLTLSRPVLTDNFEGLAAEVLPDGRLRLWIVSDDNFSKLQRTLLYAFEVTP
ncbi:esterase-like activity of phytase family protein [Hyphomonas sp.]|uniref:esterase-like activity of phytase family protein n=1 Tax=Hyphomonas sp. TaxID=87 RepID=UPI00391C819F